MKLFDKIIGFFDRYLFYDKWTCNNCGREIFNDEYFCDKCKKELPENDGNICEHCGRKTKVKEKYCLSCKGRLTHIDTARSSFTYEKPINFLIQKYKYNGKKYLSSLFCDYLYKTAVKNNFNKENIDYIVYVPMTEKALKKRGFNHGELLARKLAEKLNIPVADCIVKIKDTKRQAKSTAKERLENLKGTFRLKEKKILKDKNVLLVDDVLTTGATSETIAKLLKNNAVKRVYLLTVASVPDKKLN